MTKSYTFTYYEEKIKKTMEEKELELLLDDIEGDYEAGNLTEEEKETLICFISDQEVNIAMEGR